MYCHHVDALVYNQTCPTLVYEPDTIHWYQSKGQITILFFMKYNMSILKKSVIYRQIWQLSVKIFMVCICTLVYIYK